jgi:hypothetical protein
MYESCFSIENFTLAYQRIKTASRSPYKEFYYDDFHYFEVFFDDFIAELLHEVKEGIYSPSPCEHYYMPKKKNLARPISMLNLLDQIVYQAIANVCADTVHPVISKYFNINTFGNIFVPSSAKNSMFFYEKWKTQWKRFNQNKKKAFDKGYVYCANFDIASFYDTIDHSILISVLREYAVSETIIDLLSKCLSTWTVASTSNFSFQKTSGIPQGPTTSAFFAEVYLFKLDELMRKQKKIRYFRYADDILIMAQSEQECQKMIVYLDLLARDLSLIPQAEKIAVSHIDDINSHIKGAMIEFSQITKECKKNNGAINNKTHRKLKRQFLQCLEDDAKFDKTTIRFALFKLNDDDEVRDAIIKNISKLELLYDGVVYYFNRHFRERSSFDSHIENYLSGDTALFQYNKSLLFRSYTNLQYDEKIFRSNLCESKPFWIVQYNMIAWLYRCGKNELAEEVYEGDNYYIRRQINKYKAERLTVEARKLFIDNLVSSPAPLVSMQGLYYMISLLSFQQRSDDLNNGYMRRVLQGNTLDYIAYVFKNLYNLEFPQSLLILLRKDSGVYAESKRVLKEFLNNMTIDPSKSLMNLNLFNNILFDVIAVARGWNGQFGTNMNQMKSDYPLACAAFEHVNNARNQRTDAHYKDRSGKTRVRINKKGYDSLLAAVNLPEAYSEIFASFSDN